MSRRRSAFEDLKQKAALRLARHISDDHPIIPADGRPRSADPRQHREPGRRVPSFAEFLGTTKVQPRESRHDHESEASKTGSDSALQEPRLTGPCRTHTAISARMTDGSSGALPELLRYPPFHPRRGHAASALRPGHRAYRSVNEETSKYRL